MARVMHFQVLFILFLHSIPYSLPFFILIFFFLPYCPSSPSLPLMSPLTLPLLPSLMIAANVKKPTNITVVVSIIKAKCANLGSCGVVGEEQYFGFWGNITAYTFYAEVDTKPEILIGVSRCQPIRTKCPL